MSVPNAALYVVCHDNYSKGYSSLHYGAIPYAKIIRIPTTQYFESHLFLSELNPRKFEWEHTDYVGMITWRAKQKIPIPNFDDTIKTAKQNNADVIALYKPTCDNQSKLLEWAQRCHPHFHYLWTNMCQQLGYTDTQYDDPNIPVFYCNYWMTTPVLMNKYIEHIQKAKDILETFDTPDGEFQRRLNSDTGYRFKRPGIDHISYHCFLLERLPCLFFNVNGSKILFA